MNGQVCTHTKMHPMSKGGSVHTKCCVVFKIHFMTFGNPAKQECTMLRECKGWRGLWGQIHIVQIIVWTELSEELGSKLLSRDTWTWLKLLRLISVSLSMINTNSARLYCHSLLPHSLISPHKYLKRKRFLCTSLKASIRLVQCLLIPYWAHTQVVYVSGHPDWMSLITTRTGFTATVRGWFYCHLPLHFTVYRSPLKVDENNITSISTACTSVTDKCRKTCDPRLRCCINPPPLPTFHQQVKSYKHSVQHVGIR